MEEILLRYRSEVENELKNILGFWMKFTPDESNGGFTGKIDNNNKIYPEAEKGVVLNSRILWTFSAAYNLTRERAYLQIADRAYHFIKDHFIDKEFGGVYWTVDYNGNPSDTKKQIYALSFAVYGLSEYSRSSGNEDARSLSVALYKAIINYSYDKKNGGYIEALTRDWKDISDLRLSTKDANEKKSMNTHLHVLEGFANLYKIWPDENLKQKITDLINIFLQHIISKQTNHLILFFDEEWNIKSDIQSYGHDIEAAWLVQETAEIINDKKLTEEVKKYSVTIANAAAEGLDKDGGLWYEYEAGTDYLIKEKHSWPQAEAMVGFFNAWQLTGDKAYLEKSLNSWNFIRQHILDKKNGEWFWGVKENYEVMNEDKVGIWKCPYHSGRACMEIIKRIDKTITK